MNILIVGLGNPDKQYHQNRHNVGFQFVDWLLEDYSKRNTDTVHGFKYDKYTNSELAKISIRSLRDTVHVVLSKPLTYMNRSGESIRKLLSASTTKPPTLFVVHDDLDIRLGNFKIQKGVGPKVHNGIDSLEQSLKTKDFWRIRIGIDNRDSDYEGSGEGYVLSDFTKEEKIQFRDIFQKINTRFLDMI